MLVFQSNYKSGTSLSLSLAQRFYMQTQKQNIWGVIRPILLMGIILTGVIVVLYAYNSGKMKKEENCDSTCKILKTGILNAVTVKLM
jgi:hypothetical protein